MASGRTLHLRSSSFFQEGWIIFTLYYAKGTAALPPHIVLEELGTEYEARRLDFAKADQRSADYLAINPKGRVPTLITPQGALTETPAILAYLAQSHPEAGLAPTDPYGFAVAQSFNVYMASTVHVAHAFKQRGARWTDDPAAIEAMRVNVPKTMAECARAIEQHYLRGPWVLGDQYSICDPYLFLIARWMVADGVTISDYPGILAHRERMLARPAVQRVLPLHEL